MVDAKERPLDSLVRIAFRDRGRDNSVMNRLNVKTIPLLTILVCMASGGSAPGQTEDERTTPADVNPSPVSLLEELGATEFSARTAASTRLRQLSANDMLSLAEQAHNQPNAEVVIRIQAEIDARYVSRDPADIAIASRLLESQARDDRLMLAALAQQSLRQHWKQRIEIAIAKLQEHGAVIRRGSFARSQRNPAFLQQRPSNATQILMTESWSGGDTELAIFERLSVLCGPLISNSGIKVYLLSGNPLTAKQEARMLSVVGQNRVQKRSRVALGIVPWPWTGTGVMIDQVSRGSSAAEAGLKPGDVIVAIAEKFGSFPEQKPPPPSPNDDDDDDPDDEPGEKPEGSEDRTLLRDFDDLVDRLMNYREGDIMTIRVVRGLDRFQNHRFRQPLPPLPALAPPQQPTIKIIKVKMKGWVDMITE